MIFADSPSHHCIISSAMSMALSAVPSTKTLQGIVSKNTSSLGRYILGYLGGPTSKMTNYFLKHLPNSFADLSVLLLIL